MDRRWLFVVGSTLLLVGVATGLQFTGQYDFVQGLQSEDLQTNVIIGLSVILILVLWILAMILLAKILYRFWKMIDSHIFRIWDLIIPESPIIRFGIILTVFIFLFAFGPLVIIQLVGMDNSSEDIENQVGLNESNSSGDDPAAENETAASLNSHPASMLVTSDQRFGQSSFSVVNPAG